MAKRTRIVPGYGYRTETGRRSVLVAGLGYLKETVGGIKGYIIWLGF